MLESRDIIINFDAILDTIDYLQNVVADTLQSKQIAPLMYSFEVIGDLRRRVKRLKEIEVKKVDKE